MKVICGLFRSVDRRLPTMMERDTSICPVCFKIRMSFTRESRTDDTALALRQLSRTETQRVLVAMIGSVPMTPWFARSCCIRPP